MEEIQAFFGKLIENFGPNYTDQNIGTCMGLYCLCRLIRPEYVVEVGTSRGGSTIALAQAMLEYDQPLDRITTICRSQRNWREVMPREQGDLIKDLPLQDICVIEADFQDVDPVLALPARNVLLFYDIHDTDEFYSRGLLERWIPQIEQGFVAFHDFTPMQDHDIPDNSKKVWLRTQARHFAGTLYQGYGEVASIVWWLNSHRIPIADFDGGIWFEIPWRKA